MYQLNMEKVIVGLERVNEDQNSKEITYLQYEVINFMVAGVQR